MIGEFVGIVIDRHDVVDVGVIQVVVDVIVVGLSDTTSAMFLFKSRTTSLLLEGCVKKS